MSPSSLARKEPAGSFILSDAFEIENHRQWWKSVEGSGKMSSFVGSLGYFSS
jgi:hypothetical protein